MVTGQLNLVPRASTFGTDGKVRCHNVSSSGLEVVPEVESQLLMNSIGLLMLLQVVAMNVAVGPCAYFAALVFTNSLATLGVIA